jgi:hypothetical protein
LKRIKPYNILGIAGLLLLAISFFLPSQMVDVYVHDTYYVMDMPYVFRNLACLLLALFTVSTLIAGKLRSSMLAWFHVILTVVTILTGIVFMYRASVAYRPNFSNWTSFETNNNILAVVILTFTLAQLLFIVNLITGAIKYGSNSR